MNHDKSTPDASSRPVAHFSNEHSVANRPKSGPSINVVKQNTMGKKETRQKPKTPSNAAEPQTDSERIRLYGATLGGETFLCPMPYLTGFFLISMMLVFSRLLVPCEQSVETGTGLPWIVAWSILLLVAVLYWTRQLWRIRKNPNALPINAETLTNGGYGPEWLRPFAIQDHGWLYRLITLFFLWILTSGYSHWANGPARTTFNQMLEIFGLLLLFRWFHFVFRAREAFRRSMLAWMLSLGIGLAALGCYQYFIEMPATRAAYAANPDEMLRESGLWFAPDSPQRMMFENRLESVEPFGTFALTNSLAGFLTPWLVIGVIVLGEWLVSRWKIRRQDTASEDSSRDTEKSRIHSRIEAWNLLPRWKKIASSTMLIGSIAMMAICLLLTKSRAGYLAVLVGTGIAVLAMLFYQWYTDTTHTRRPIPWMKYGSIAALLGGIVAAFVGFAIAVGGIDLEVISEAKKSLGYRLEYWSATSHLIADYPFTGVGPTHFQTFYPQYKLPQSSEEIADPHNFIMEIAASYGLPALLIFALLLGILAYRTLRAMRFCLTRHVTPPAEQGGDMVDSEATAGLLSSGSPFAPYWVVLVTIGGGFLAWFFGGMTETPPAPLNIVIFSVAVAAAYPIWNFALWQLSDKRFLRLLALSMGILAFGVNLLAAGGFGMPGMICVFWILLAMLWVEIQLAEPPRPVTLPTPPQLRRQRRSSVLVIAAIFLTVVLVIHDGLQPSLQCRALLVELQSSVENESSMAFSTPETTARWQYERAERYLAAAAADPLTETPWLQWANELVQTPANQRAIRLLTYAQSSALTSPSFTISTSQTNAVNPEISASPANIATGGISPSVKRANVADATMDEKACAEWVLRTWRGVAKKLITFTPKSSKNYRMLAGQASEIAAMLSSSDIPTAEIATQIAQYQALAVTWYKQAVRYYPNSAELRAEYAVALHQSGDLEGFERERETALQLDALTPHQDKKLSEKMRKAIQSPPSETQPLTETPTPLPKTP